MTMTPMKKEKPITEEKLSHDKAIKDRIEQKKILITKLEECLKLLEPLEGSLLDKDITNFYNGDKAKNKINGAIFHITKL